MNYYNILVLCANNNSIHHKKGYNILKLSILNYKELYNKLKNKKKEINIVYVGKGLFESKLDKNFVPNNLLIDDENFKINYFYENLDLKLKKSIKKINKIVNDKKFDLIINEQCPRKIPTIPDPSYLTLNEMIYILNKCLKKNAYYIDRSDAPNWFSDKGFEPLYTKILKLVDNKYTGNNFITIYDYLINSNADWSLFEMIKKSKKKSKKIKMSKIKSKKNKK